MTERILLAIVALLVALLVGLGFFWNPELPQRLLPKAGMAAGGEFTLQSASGPVALKDFRGKLVLVYFGYTNCPDVCPASLAAGGQALNALTPDERKQVKLIMVSVDPERDSVKHLKEYTAFFHGEMSGVTGTTAEIASLAKAFGAGYIKQPAKADGSYAVDHTVSTYVVDRDGKLAAVLDLGVTTDKLVATIRKLL